jgi:hypothetical protein
MMTHDRATAAIVGCGAVLLLVADVVYVIVRWAGVGSRFDRSFLVGVAVLIVLGLVARAFGVGKPLGADRDRARRRAQRLNGIFAVSIVLTVAVSSRFGNIQAVLLGEFAALTAGFGVACIRELLHPRAPRLP